MWQFAAKQFDGLSYLLTNACSFAPRVFFDFLKPNKQL
jgi:hypothetical protein